MDRKISDDTDRFLAGEMDPQEEAGFAAQAGSDPVLEGDIALTGAVIEELIKDAEGDLLEELRRIPSERHLRRKLAGRRRSGRRNLYIVAAATAAVILIMVGMSPRYSGQELFADHFTAPEYEYIPYRGGAVLTPRAEELRRLGIDLYRDGQIEAASAVFSSLLAEGRTEDLPDEVLYYAAVSFIASGTEPCDIPAEALLGELIENSPLYGADATWTLALLKLRDGDRSAAAALLAELEGNGKYGAAAEELTQKIKYRRWFR